MAAIVHAAFLIVDPLNLLGVGVNTDADNKYDEVESRVWQRVMNAYLKVLAQRLREEEDDGSAPLTVAQTVRIVDEELCTQFGGEPGADPEFAEIIGHEFDDTAEALLAWPAAVATASLIDLGLQTMAW